MKSRLIICLIFTLVSSVSAERSVSAYGYAALERFIPQKVANYQEGDFKPVSSRMAVQIPGLGRVELEYFIEKPRQNVPLISDDNGTHYDFSGITLLAGQAKVRGQTLPMSASVYHEEAGAVAHSSFLYQSGSNSNPQLYTINVNLDGDLAGTATLDTAGREAQFKKLCSTLKLPDGAIDSQGTSQKNTTSAQDTASQSTYLMELALYGDKAWSETHGSNANNVITAIINDVEEIYAPQLDIDLTITHQEILSSKTFGTQNNDNSYNSEGVLTDFQATIQQRSEYGIGDAYHLFTGEDMASGVIGLAYVGVICASEAYSFGLSQWVSTSATPITFAHEVGHNLSAEHDSSEPKTIMYPSLNSSNEFSSFSKGQIADHLSTYGDSCLKDGEDNNNGGGGGGDSGGGGNTGGGGSGTDPGNLTPIDISLDVSFDPSTGTINIDSEVTSESSAYTNSDCTVSLRIGTSKSRASYSSVVTSFGLYSSSNTLRGTLSRKANKYRITRSGITKAKYFITETVSCLDGSSGEVTTPVRVAFERIKSNQSALSLKGFKKQLKNSLQLN